MKSDIIYDAIIIGAGLTGLTLAFYLKKYGLNIKVVEKNTRSGGVIRTYKEQGFIYETGPNSGVLSTPEAAELFEDLSDTCGIEIADEKANDRWILKNSKWESLPAGLIPAIKTPLFSLKDKLNILAEPFRAKGSDPHESVADLVRRRLGESFLDYAVDPFISGIYAGDPEKLVTKYALPKLYNLEQIYGSFIKGAYKKRMEGRSEREQKATRKVFSAENGLQSMISALEKKIGISDIILNSENIHVDVNQRPFKVNFEKNGIAISLEAERVITTSGAYSLTNMLPDIDGKLLKPVSTLKYAKVAQVILGYKDWKGIALNSFGGLIPAKEKRNILGVLFMSSIFKNRAPESGALISVFIGGERMPQIVDLKDEQIIEITEKEIDDLLGLNGEKADLIRVVRYAKAIPQYESSTKERYEAIDKIENRYEGLILAGNIRDGIGMADRIAQGRKIADSIIMELKNG